MNKILLIDNSLISAWAYPDRKIVHHRMKTFCHGQEFRDALAKIIEAMERYSATRYLSDNRAGGAVTREDTEWAGEFWFPRAMAVGWSRWSIVQPKSIIGQMNMMRHAENTLKVSGVDARVFSDPQAAMKWLEGA